jgi:hypothetical protein
MNHTEFSPDKTNDHSDYVGEPLPSDILHFDEGTYNHTMVVRHWHSGRLKTHDTPRSNQ